jgi:hypothetical protein
VSRLLSACDWELNGLWTLVAAAVIIVTDHCEFFSQFSPLNNDADNFIVFTLDDEVGLLSKVVNSN